MVFPFTPKRAEKRIILILYQSFGGNTAGGDYPHSKKVFF